MLAIRFVHKLGRLTLAERVIERTRNNKEKYSLKIKKLTMSEDESGPALECEDTRPSHPLASAMTNDGLRSGIDHGIFKF